MKSIIANGLVAAVLASTAGIVYRNVYETTLHVNFNQSVNNVSIGVASAVGCFLMAAGFILLERYKRWHLKGWLNLLITILSFASIIGAMHAGVPVQSNKPELLAGLIAPLHLLPALAFFTVSPLFNKLP